MTPRIPIENWSDRELEEAKKVTTPIEILREVVLELFKRQNEGKKCPNL